MIDRRTALGLLAGSGLATVDDAPASGTACFAADPRVVELLQAVREAVNTTSSGALHSWCAPGCRMEGWDAAVETGRDDPARIDAFFAHLRQRIGPIRDPIAAGQFLVSRDRRLIRYVAGFGEGDVALTLEIALLLTADRAKLRALKFVDPAVFGTAATVVVDAPGDGRTDVTARVQAAYDGLVRQGGGTLQFPPGLFRLSLTLGSRNVQLRGAGRLATRLTPAATDGVALRGAYRSGTWDAVTIRDLCIEGGGALQGIGFRAGDDEPATDDEFVGRTRFENVRFGNLAVCIDRPRGQLGLTITDCQFEDARVHLAGRARQAPGRPIMHGGNILIRGTHFQQARDAVFRLDADVTGSGQVTFEDCIMEANPGIVFDVRNMNAGDGVPAMLVRRCWNEENGTASLVHLGRRSDVPLYARLTNCSLIRFEDTPIGPLQMTNSVVRTIDSSLDRLTAVDQDARSILTHDRARLFSGPTPPGLVESVEATYLNTPNRGSSFALTPRRALSSAYRSALRIGSAADQPISFSGTASVATSPVAAAALPGKKIAQQLILPSGARLFPSPVPIAAGRWIAWLYIYRHMAGAVPLLNLTGSDGLTLETPLEATQWCTLGGITTTAKDVASLSLWHHARDGAATVQIGGINLLAFDTRQEATTFLNSGLFAV